MTVKVPCDSFFDAEASALRKKASYMREFLGQIVFSAIGVVANDPCLVAWSSQGVDDGKLMGRSSFEKLSCSGFVIAFVPQLLLGNHARTFRHFRLPMFEDISS